MEYINVRTQGHKRTEFDILSGKRWHDKNFDIEEDKTERVKIRMPSGKVIETGTPLQTVPSGKVSIGVGGIMPAGGGTPTGGGGGGY